MYCATCRWWVDSLEEEDARHLTDRPDGWNYCAYSKTDGMVVIHDTSYRLAVVLETDMSIGILATSPDYGCVAWQAEQEEVS